MDAGHLDSGHVPGPDRQAHRPQRATRLHRGRRVPPRLVDAPAQHVRRDIRRALEGLLHLDRVRTGHRRRGHVAHHLQRRHPAGSGVETGRTVPFAPTRREDGRRLPAAQPLPHRCHLGDVHARRLHPRHGLDHPIRLRQLLRRRAAVRRRLRRRGSNRAGRRRRRHPQGPPAERGRGHHRHRSPVVPACRSSPVEREACVRAIPVAGC